MNKKNLLSIGEIAKITETSIKSLRYYERIGAIEPAYIDPNSKYRYYSIEQTYVVGLIRACVELDIPIKDIIKFTDADNIDFRNFLEYGEQIANKKLKAIKSSLAIIRDTKQNMDLAEMHKDGQIYTRAIPEKIFLVRPCDKPTEVKSWMEVILPFSEELPPNGEYDKQPEYGFLSEHSPAGVSHYIFIEAPDSAEYQCGENIKKIPAGNYYCKQNKFRQLNNVCEIFKDYLVGVDSFIVIEAEIIVGQFKFTQPPTELRVIARI